MELSVEFDPETVVAETAETSCGITRERPVDLVHLAKYTHGNRELEQEVLALFQSQSAVYFARLKAADCEKSWHDAAHSLKGSAKAIGAWRVAAAAERLEASGAEALEGEKARMLDALKRDLDEACTFIDGLD